MAWCASIETVSSDGAKHLNRDPHSTHLPQAVKHSETNPTARARPVSSLKTCFETVIRTSLNSRSAPNIAVRMKALKRETAVAGRIGHTNPTMRVHLINPSDTSFGTAVITPRWLYVLAAATPASFGDPVLCDETLRQWDSASVRNGDVVGIGIHTGNALRGYAVGRMARERGAWVIFGGIHSTLYPDEAFAYGGAHAVVRGDG